MEFLFKSTDHNTQPPPHSIDGGGKLKKVQVSVGNSAKDLCG